MCMNKEFVVKEIDPFQTINRFIRKIYPEGYAAFPQYGDSSRTKTERFTTVPFMMMNGSMQWKVPIKIATMGEFLTTFEMDSNDTVIVEKVALETKSIARICSMCFGDFIENASESGNQKEGIVSLDI